MSRTIYEATGTTDDGATIVLDTPLPLRGRVKVQVQPEALAQDSETAYRQLMRFLEAIHQAQQERGHIPPTPEVVEQYLREVRSGWREREANLP